MSEFLTAAENAATEAETVVPTLLQQVVDFLHFLFPNHPNLPGPSTAQIAATTASGVQPASSGTAPIPAGAASHGPDTASAS